VSLLYSCRYNSSRSTQKLSQVSCSLQWWHNCTDWDRHWCSRHCGSFQAVVCRNTGPSRSEDQSSRAPAPGTECLKTVHHQKHRTQRKIHRATNTNNSNVIWYKHQITAHDTGIIYSAPKLHFIRHISCHSFTDVLMKYNSSYLSKTHSSLAAVSHKQSSDTHSQWCIRNISVRCLLAAGPAAHAIAFWSATASTVQQHWTLLRATIKRPTSKIAPAFVSYNSDDHIHSMTNLRWPHISICHVTDVEQSAHVHPDWVFNCHY